MGSPSSSRQSPSTGIVSVPHELDGYCGTVAPARGRGGALSSARRVWIVTVALAVATPLPTVYSKLPPAAPSGRVYSTVWPSGETAALASPPGWVRPTMARMRPEGSESLSSGWITVVRPGRTPWVSGFALGARVGSGSGFSRLRPLWVEAGGRVSSQSSTNRASSKE